MQIDVVCDDRYGGEAYAKLFENIIGDIGKSFMIVKAKLVLRVLLVKQVPLVLRVLSAKQVPQVLRVLSVKQVQQVLRVLSVKPVLQAEC